jgi:hypothetical protein
MQEVFYKVFFKCDDVFNPKPSHEIDSLVRKLIRQKLPHMVLQNRIPTMKEMLENCIVKSKNFLGLGKDYSGELSEIYCIETHSEPVDWSLHQVEREMFYTE